MPESTTQSTAQSTTQSTTQSTKPKIVFEGVRKEFTVKDHRGDRQGTRFTALDGIDLEIAAGEFIVLVGPSGCG
jgi:NitT/TauT family transport system ATP-binding protein